MNFLSWLILSANLLFNIKIVLGIFICVILFVYFATYITADVNNTTKDFYKFWRKLGYGLLFCLCLVLITPSPTTLYLIAASQFGEKALHTPEAKLVQEVIIKKLNDQLRDNK